MTFVRAVEKDDTNKCPNCGAKIKDTHSLNCEYCNSVIVKKANKFILSKKTNINK